MLKLKATPKALKFKSLKEFELFCEICDLSFVRIRIATGLSTKTKGFVCALI